MTLTEFINTCSEKISSCAENMLRFYARAAERKHGKFYKNEMTLDHAKSEEKCIVKAIDKYLIDIFPDTDAESFELKYVNNVPIPNNSQGEKILEQNRINCGKIANYIDQLQEKHNFILIVNHKLDGQTCNISADINVCATY